MPIIIDGWNLIRSDSSRITDIDRDSLEAASELISYLTDFQRSRGDPITLVFDSTNEFLAIEYADSDKLKIIPARNADDYIKKHIDMTPERERRNLRVISSDSSIFYYARSCYATPVRSEDFWHKLKRNRKKKTPPSRYG